MANKLYDVVVKTGTYTDAQGQQKNRYENIGTILEGNDGPFMLLKRTFNPAGVPTDRDTIMVSLFQPQKSDVQRQQEATQQPQPSGPVGAAPGFGSNNPPF